VTCLAVLEDLSQIAVGLCNEAVILIKGDIAREKTSKQILLQPEGENPVTGTLTLILFNDIRTWISRIWKINGTICSYKQLSAGVLYFIKRHL
jgi:hypothetical protein